jgi:hypothetical protein
VASAGVGDAQALPPERCKQHEDSQKKWSQRAADEVIREGTEKLIASQIDQEIAELEKAIVEGEQAAKESKAKSAASTEEKNAARKEKEAAQLRYSAKVKECDAALRNLQKAERKQDKQGMTEWGMREGSCRLQRDQLQGDLAQAKTDYDNKVATEAQCKKDDKATKTKLQNDSNALAKKMDARRAALARAKLAHGRGETASKNSEAAKAAHEKCLLTPVRYM